jgi:P2-related tail formation protein
MEDELRAMVATIRGEAEQLQDSLFTLLSVAIGVEAWLDEWERTKKRQPVAGGSAERGRGNEIIT